MFSDTRPAPLDDEGDPEALTEFRVREPAELHHLLKSLMDRNVVVNLNGSDGSVYSTTVWMVDAAQRKIGFAADLMAPAVHRLVEADEAVAVAYLDQIKLQFEVADRMLVHGHQACVLQARLPSQLYRFQRRNAYRVRTLERGAPTASFRHPAIPDMQLELRVLDLSAGGCALFMPADLPMVQPGVSVNGVQFELDVDTSLRAGLRVHHVTSIQPQARGVRLGCEVLGLSPEGQRLLQRYIDNTQKRRRMMSLD